MGIDFVGGQEFDADNRNSLLMTRRSNRMFAASVHDLYFSKSSSQWNSTFTTFTIRRDVFMTTYAAFQDRRHSTMA